MYKYLGSISDLSHYIIDNFVYDKSIAVDATLGNGYDSDFLSNKFDKVFSFDIQRISCDIYSEKKIKNVEIINDSHHKFDKYIHEKVNCIIYNLGFLPGGNKKITTLHETTLESIQKGLNILDHGGIMSICMYKGHSEGKIEEAMILDYVKNLPKNIFAVMNHTYINRSELSPSLIIIEKK